jgi:wyosine [tRNA(Phe)-imidazoG37] synthetase (radical SAM superfamily)
MTCRRREFYSPVEIYTAVKSKIGQLKCAGEKIDYLTFVPDGEPTLDAHLDESIRSLKSLGYPIAVITNSSLMSENSVRNDLLNADWVSLKIDTAEPRIWKEINRPHGALELTRIIDGIKDFSFRFSGTLVTETMLVHNVNDGATSIHATADLIRTVNPRKAYILIPTRPPAVSTVVPADSSALTAAYQTFLDFGIDAELVVNTEGTDFTFCTDLEKELLNILSVHPMRTDAVEKFLARSHSGWEVIERLKQKHEVNEVTYNTQSFIARSFERSTMP